ncbi:MAG TPA: hypothetical protein VLE99_01290 [Candidatus Saccharimonadales bacterium]|nr:hypothetical protein [Candidatus Saccharimonadales bacterium]
MTIWWLILVVGSLAAVCGGFVWVVLTLNRLSNGGGPGKKTKEDLSKAYSDIAEEDATHLFNKEFREELRNRGRLRFEKIIDENAMFLKQDLDMTISQLNDYMKHEISTKLDAEFAAYAKAMKEAQELALTTLRKTAEDVEAQRTQLAEALKKDVAERETIMLQMYETNMAKIVEHYVLQALGDQFDLQAQLPYIIKQMEANKQAIMEDMRL